MEEEENFLKVFRLVTGPGTECVRHIFDKLLPPTTLNSTLNLHKSTTIKDLIRKRRITAAQDALLYPPSGAGATSTTFDLSLMICLIRNLTTTSPPINGFDKLPLPSETSVGADIARIKFVRNLLAHTDKNTMSKSDFSLHWSCLYDAIVRQGAPVLKIKCDDIKNIRLFNDVEIQDFNNQVADFKHVLLAEIMEIEEKVSNVENRVSEVEKDNSGVGERVKHVEDRVNVNNDRVTGVVDRVTDVADRITGVDHRVRGVEDKVIDVAERVTGVDDRVTGIDDRVYGVEDKVTGVEDKVIGVDDRLTNVTDQVSTVVDRVSVVEREIGDLMKTEDDQRIIPTHIQKRFQKRIDEWQKEDEQFVTTAASKQVMKCVEQNSCVSVIGNSGTGKTFTARHTALQMKRQGYLIVPVIEPRDLDYFQHGRKTLFVVDDFCGRFTLNESYLNDWRRVLETIESLMKDTCFKIITTCRLQVFQDEKFKLLSLFKKCVCNISSQELRLTSDEIDSLVAIYVSDFKDSLPQLSDDIDFYPLLFSLYNKTKKKTKNVKSFFSHPFECYKDELDTLEIEGTKGKIKYCGLVLCVMFNNTLSVNDILGKTHHKGIIKKVLVECEVEHEPRKTICKEIETLNDSFVVKNQDMYIIIHDKLFDFLAKYFGEKMTDIFINFAHPDFIKERFLCAKFYTDEEAEFLINIPDEYIQMYIDRLFDDWEKGEIHRVFTNSHMKSTEFRKTFFACFQNQPNEDQVKLVSIQDIESLDTPLHGLSIYGDVEQAKWMIEKGAVVGVGNKDSETALYIACENGHLDLLRFFIQFGTSINAQTVKGWSPLHTACYNNNVEVVKELLKHDHIDIDVCASSGETSLYVSCEEGHVDVVRLLLQHPVDINKTDENGRTPFHTACNNNQIEVVKELLKSDQIDIDLCDSTGITSLYLACSNGFVEVVRLLLQHYANINKTGNWWDREFTPLHTASYNNQIEVVKELLKSDHIDIDVCNSDGETSLHLACKKGNVDVVRLLLQHSANINKADQDGRTPFHTACYNNQIEVVTELLKSDNIDIDVCDSNGETSLHLACKKGNVDVVRLLLQHSANINKADQDGRTPFLSACYDNKIEVVRELLKYDQIDIDVSLITGRTALKFKEGEIHAKIFRLLLEHSDKINKIKWTSLQKACFYNKVEDVKDLLKIKATDIEICDERGQTSLYLACERGNIDIVRLLLNQFANVNKANDDGWTPFHTACYNNQVQVVKELLKSENVDIDVCDSNGRTSLYLACEEGYTDVIRLLIQHSSNINKTDEDGWTPFLAACHHNHLEAIKELLKSDLIDIDVCVSRGKTSLHLATEKGNVDVVSLLLQHSANINKTDQDGWTPLHTACFFSHIKVVQELLRSDQIDIDVCDSKGKTSFHLACEIGYANVIRLLLQNSANINKSDQNGWTPFYTACYHNHEEVVRELLKSDQIDIGVGFITGRASLQFKEGERHADVVRLLLQHSDKLKWTPLQKACFYNKVEDVKDLLEIEATDIEVCDERGQTALYLACERGNIDIVQLLLNQFANVNKANDDGWTPLHTACYNNQAEVVRELLKSDQIDIDVCDSEGKTSLYLACGEGHLDVVKLLLLHSSNINKTDEDGRTPLHIACFCNKIEVVKALLKNDQINTEVGDSKGQTALHLACWIGHVDVVTLLLQHPVNINKTDAVGQTSFHSACNHNRIEVVKELLKSDNIDIDLCDSIGRTSLYLVCSNGFVEVVRLLLQHSANINKPNCDWWDPGLTPLHTASYNNQIEVVKELLKSDHIDIDVCDSKGETSLHLACTEGNVDVVRLLLQHSANINKADQDGRTPFLSACYDNKIEVVRELLKYDQIDIDVSLITGRTALKFKEGEIHAKIFRLLLEHSDKINKIKWTSLHKACFYNKVEDVKDLLKIKATDIEICDERGQTSLYLACERGNIDIVRLLLNQFANVNKANDDGWTPFHTACYNNQVQVVKELLKRENVDIDVCDSNGRTSLYLACEEGHIDVIRLLLQHSSNINKTDEDGWTPFHAACHHNHLEAVKELLKIDLIDIDVCVSRGKTSLHLASEKGNVDVVSLLLQHSANINKTDQDGWTPLHTACFYSQTKVVQELLRSDQIDIDVCDSKGKTSFHLACTKGYANVIRLLLQNSANINKSDQKGWTPLYTACYRNHEEVVRELLKSDQIDIGVGFITGRASLQFKEGERHADVVRLLLQHSDKLKWTPLQKACFYNKVEDVKDLLEMEATDIEVCDERGQTSLYLACERGNIDIVQLLLNQFANVNKANDDRWTPLHTACYNNQAEVVRELLKSEHIDVNVPDSNGKTALYLTCEEGHVDLVKLLSMHSSNMNTTGYCKQWRQGWTPLHIACFYNQIEIVKELLKSDTIDIDVGDCEDRTSLYLACEEGYVDVVKLLLKHSANINKAGEDGKTPFHTACYDNQVDVVRELLKIDHIDIDVGLITGCNSLQVKEGERHAFVVRLLLQHSDKLKWTPLQKACFYNKLNDVKELLKIEATDIEICDERGQTSMYLACERGNIDIVRLLLNQFANVNKANDDGWTPFHTACYNNQVQVVKELLKSENVDIDVCDSNGRTSLYLACEEGHIDVIRLLIQHSSNINKTDEDGWTPFHAACHHNHLEAVKELLKSDLIDIDVCVSRGKTSLHLASEKGNVDVVSLLLQHSANINKTDQDGRTPLHTACFYSQIKVVQELLRSDQIDIDVCDSKGKTSFHLACTKGYANVIRLLLQHSANINKADLEGRTPFRTACYNNQVEVVRELLKYDQIYIDVCLITGRTALKFKEGEIHANVVRLLLEHSDKIKWTSLQKACFYNKVEDVKELMKIEATDIEVCDERGQTALYLACERGNIDIVRLLLNQFANVNKANDDGWTPLHTACYNNQVQVVKELLKSENVDIDVCDSNGRTTLYLACEEGHIDVIRLLIQHSSNINKTDEDGWTPFHAACHHNHLEAITELLNSDLIDIDVCVSRGKTSLHLASEKGNVDVVSLLLQHSANINKTDQDGWTPLHTACFYSQTKVVQELLRSDQIDIDVCDSKGKTSFHLACTKGYANVIRLLLQNSANINKSDQKGWTPLYTACYRNHEEVVRELLKSDQIDIGVGFITGRASLQFKEGERHADVVRLLLQHSDKLKWTPLQKACFYNKVEDVKDLLEIEATDIEVCDERGQTSLYLACERGNIDIVQLLLNQFANVNKANDDGWTPLHTACYNNQAEVVRELLKSEHIDVNVPDSNGKTALYLTCEEGHVDLVKLLSMHSSNMNTTGYCKQWRQGWTPLHIACFYNQIEIVKELLKSDTIDIDVGDCEDRTSLYLACEEGYVDVVKLLLKHSANINKAGEDGKTPFHTACYDNQVEVVRELLKIDHIDIDVGLITGCNSLQVKEGERHAFVVRLLLQHSDKLKWTPLQKACFYNKLNDVKELLKIEATDIEICDERGQTSMYLACERGNIDIVRLLLNQFANVNKANDDGWTPFHTACYNNQVQVVKELLKSENVDIDVCDSNGRTSLYLACEEGHIDVIRLLIQHSSNINKTDEDGWTPFHAACHHNHLEAVKELLKSDLIDIDVCVSRGKTSLHLASEKGNVDVVSLLLQHSANINKTDQDGRTPLHTACFYSQIKVVQELLRSDQIDIDVCDSKGKTSFHLACTKGYANVIRLLLQHSANINKADLEGRTPFRTACYNNQVEVVRELLKYDQIYIDVCLITGRTALKFKEGEIHANVVRLLLEHSDKIKWTSLQKACFYNKVEDVKELMKIEATDIEVCDERGQTALYLACERGNIDIVRLLLNQFANVNKANDDGWTPLHTACYNNQVQVVKELLKSENVDIDVCDSNGRTTLYLACEEGHIDVIRLLIQHSSNINKTDEDGWTPFHAACHHNHLEAIKELLNSDLIDIDVCVSRGKTSLHLASEKGNVDVVSLLLQHSANINKTDQDGWTPLHTACFYSQTKVVQELLRSDQIDIDVCDSKGKTSFHLACTKGYANVIRLLLQNSANINKSDQKGWTPLYTACYRNHEEVVRELLKSDQIDIGVGFITGRASLQFKEGERHADVVRLLLQHSDKLKWTPLQKACFYNKVEDVKDLLEIEATDIEVCDERGQTSLYLACERGNIDIVQLLLNQFANVNKANDDGWTPLHTACYNNQAEVVRELLKSEHIDVNVPDSNGKTALYLTCEEGHVDLVKLLSMHSSNMNTTGYCKQWRQGWTPLHIACFYNQIEIVKELLKSDTIDIDVGDCEDRTSLYLACEEGYVDVVKLLLKHSANINKAGEDGKTPFHTACYDNQVEVVRELLKIDHIDIDVGLITGCNSLQVKEGERHAFVVRLLLQHSDKLKWTPLQKACFYNKLNDVKELLKIEATDIEICDERGQTSMYLACERGNIDIVRLLLNQFANVNKANDDGWTPFHTACYNNQVQVVKELLKSENVDIDVCDSNGRTSLYLACEEGHIDVIRLLIQHSSNINKTDEDGWTPFHAACHHNHLEAVKELLNSDLIDIDVCVSRGKTSLHLASEKGNVDVVSLLLQHSANINKTDQDGRTPLHTACFYSQIKVVQELLRSDQIDIDVCDSKGKTSFHLACTKGYANVIRLLLQNSANINKSDQKGWTPLYTACYRNHEEVVRELLKSNQIDICVGFITGRASLQFKEGKRHADIVRLLLQHSDKLKWTPLQRACFYNKIEDVKDLLEIEATDIEVCDERGQTALYLACERGNIDIVRLLLNQFANVNKANDDGWTPLHTACYNNQAEVVRELLKSEHIDVNVPDSNGKTALYLTCEEGHVDLVKLLSMHSSNMNTTGYCKQWRQGWTPLHIACFYNQIEIVKELLKSDTIDIDVGDSEGKTSLYLACGEGHVDVVRLLLLYSSNINKTDEDGWTPLHTTCYFNHFEAVKELLKSEQIDIDVCDSEGKTSLYLACGEGHVDVVRLLLLYSSNINKTDEDGWTPLHIACFYNQIEIVKELLKSDTIDIDVGDSEGRTSLYLACEEGYVDVVKLLLKHSANINKAGEDGKTPFHTACYDNQIEVVKELLKSDQINIDVSDSNRRTSLYLACKQGHVDITKLLLKHSANINIPDKHGQTPFHIACYDNQVEVVRELLKSDHIDIDVGLITGCNSLQFKGESHANVVRLLLQHSDKLKWTPLQKACFYNKIDDVKELLKTELTDIEVCDEKGQNSLNLACERGNIDIVRLLLNQFANVNKSNDDGWTPLHTACYNNQAEVVKELLKSDQIDINAPDSNGRTSFYLACREGYVVIVRLLLQHFSNINKTDEDGWTPLHTSSYNNQRDVVKELLKQDQIDINVPNKEGSTSLYLACSRGHIDIVRLLLEHSADVNQPDFEGCTPLIIACQQMHTEIVFDLLNHKADVDAKMYDGGNALLSACRNECLEIVKILLQYGGDPNSCLPSKSVMELRIMLHSMRTVEQVFEVWYDEIYRKVADDLKIYLFDKPVQYTFDLCAGCSCLHFASLLGFIDIVQILIRHCANVNIAKEDGTTPLFIACEFGKLDVVKLLLAEGGKTGLGRINGIKPLDIAVANGHFDVASCLMKHDDMFSDVRVPDS